MKDIIKEVDSIASIIATMINKYASKEDRIKLKKSFVQLEKDFRLLSMANYVLYHSSGGKTK